LISAAQFDTERARRTPLPAAWVEPGERVEGIHGEGGRSDMTGRTYWRWYGEMPETRAVIAVRVDDTEAPVIVCGPVWCVEVEGEAWLRSIDVGGEVYELKATADPASPAQAMIGTPRPRLPQGARVGDLPEGIAWLTWEPSDGGPGSQSPERGRYVCSLQSPAGERLPKEMGPLLETLEDALDWARARTANIVVVPQWDPHHAYRVTGSDPGAWERWN
jgi:hypothetical protein